MNIIVEKIINAIIILSVVSVFVAIFIDFKLFESKNDTKRGKRSIVATGSMIGFYLVYYSFLRFRIGTIHFSNDMMIIIGTAMILAGAIINIIGRLNLKDNWANHIKIYNGHKLVTIGVYRLVRHPLYSSIMLMLFGGTLAYRNWISFALTIFIFIPFMYYRAKQEEKLLSMEFEDYTNYKKQVGMFFPKINYKRSE
jgi:protein-S-isoprenylcysteine O-methyltransferase Ste14